MTSRGAAGAERRGQSSWRVTFAVALAVSAYVLLAPDDGTPSVLPDLDKVVHVLIFAALALTGRRAGVALVPLVIGLLVYAAGSELLQGTDLLGRSRSGWDALADALGIALGVVAAERLERLDRRRSVA